jgi:hypothetical protein
MILRLLNAQGIAGLVASLCLALLLTLEKVESRHWRRQSSKFEQLFIGERAKLAGTIANYRAAASAAATADRANAERVAAEQRAITERTDHDFEGRISAARAAADRLRLQSEGRSVAGAGRSAEGPGLPGAAGGTSQAAGHDRLPEPAALTATEQAIQLDELIRWVRAQAGVDVNSGGSR